MNLAQILDFLGRGGPLMIPIALCSVVGLALFLERLYSLRPARVLPAGLTGPALEHLRAGRLTEAQKLLEAAPAIPAAAILLAGLRHASAPRAHIKDVMEEVGRREVHYLERFVDGLGAIATVAPLLGLLGTVTGMIGVFRQVMATASSQGVTDAAALAGGIWEALITTAAGLGVAIPLFLAHRYILARVDRLAVQLEELGLGTLDQLSAEGLPQLPASPAAPLAATHAAEHSPEAA